MTDGTFTGRQPVKEIPDNIRDSQEHALTLWPDIRSYVTGLPELNRVYLVGAGGSLSGLHAAQYFLDRRATTPVTSVNSDEFY
jgi:fructoselysine 6-phosphate deglycase